MSNPYLEILLTELRQGTTEMKAIRASLSEFIADSMHGNIVKKSNQTAQDAINAINEAIRKTDKVSFDIEETIKNE